MARRKAARRKKTTKKPDPHDHLFDGLEDLYRETVIGDKDARAEERRARRSLDMVLSKAVGWRDSPGVDYASSLALRLRYVALYLKSAGAWPPALSEGRAPQVAMAMLIECGDGAPGWRSRAAGTFRRFVQIAEDTGHLSDSASGKQGAQHSLLPDRDSPLYFRSLSSPSLWRDLRRDHARVCSANMSNESDSSQRLNLNDPAATTAVGDGPSSPEVLRLDGRKRSFEPREDADCGDQSEPTLEGLRDAIATLESRSSDERLNYLEIADLWGISIDADKFRSKHVNRTGRNQSPKKLPSTRKRSDGKRGRSEDGTLMPTKTWSVAEVVEVTRAKMERSR